MSARGVIFDLDGVLVDSAGAHLAAYERVFCDAGLEFAAEAAEAVRDGKPRAHVIEIAAPAAEAKVRRALAAAKPAALESVLRDRGNCAMPGAVETVQALAAKGVAMGVVTNSRTPEIWLRRLGVEAELPVVIGGDDVPSPKPSPAGYLLAAERLGIEPSRCVAFEDSEDGWKAARLADMRVVVVATKRPPWTSTNTEVVTNLEPASVLARVAKA